MKKKIDLLPVFYVAAVAPMISVAVSEIKLNNILTTQIKSSDFVSNLQNQLVGAIEGKNITLECATEAYPKTINYWTYEKGDIVPKGMQYFGYYSPTSNLRLQNSNSNPKQTKEECSENLMKMCYLLEG